MKKPCQLTIIIVLLLARGLYAQNDKVEIVIKINKNSEKVLISAHDIIKFIYKNDTVIKSISTGKLFIDSSIFSTPIIAIQIYFGRDILEIPYLKDSIHYFKEKIELNSTLPKEFVFDYFTNYQLAKKSYGTHMSIEEKKFKSMVVWSCNMCSSGVFTDDIFIEEKK